MSKIASRLTLALVAVAMCFSAWPAQGATTTVPVDGVPIAAEFSNMDEFDKSLDPVLAGTLAGLALAAATFLIAFRVSVADRVVRITREGGQAKQADLELLASMKTAVGFLVASFYVFVGLLVESLTVDKWVEPHALLSGQRDWALPTDVGVAGLTLTSGVVLLGLGAVKISSIVAQEVA
jgi:hypothetical protein